MIFFYQIYQIYQFHSIICKIVKNLLNCIPLIRVCNSKAMWNEMNVTLILIIDVSNFNVKFLLTKTMKQAIQ